MEFPDDEGRLIHLQRHHELHRRSIDRPVRARPRGRHRQVARRRMAALPVRWSRLKTPAARRHCTSRSPSPCPGGPIGASRRFEPVIGNTTVCPAGIRICGCASVRHQQPHLSRRSDVVQRQVARLRRARVHRHRLTYPVDPACPSPREARSPPAAMPSPEVASPEVPCPGAPSPDASAPRAPAPVAPSFRRGSRWW